MRIELVSGADLQKSARMIVVPACDSLKRRGTTPDIAKALRATG